MMGPALRRLALTAHITASVGWLGAVGAFLALSLAGLTSREEQVVRAAFIAADLATRAVIVPLCLAALGTGLIQSLGTQWGLFRHYWVLAKLLLTVLGTLLLLLHTQPIAYMADAAVQGTLAGGALREVRVQLVADAAAALLVLLAATALSVYKPRGVTRYGWRRQLEQRALAA